MLIAFTYYLCWTCPVEKPRNRLNKLLGSSRRIGHTMHAPKSAWERRSKSELYFREKIQWENSCFYVLLKTEVGFIDILHSTAQTSHSSHIDPKGKRRISARDNLEGLESSSQRQHQLTSIQDVNPNLRCPQGRWCGRSRCRRRGAGGGCRCAHGEPHRR